MEKEERQKESKLPVTRRRQLLYLLKTQWKVLLLCGVVVLLFSLPLHASAIYDDLYSNMLIAQKAAGEITAEQQTSLYSTFSYIRWLAEIAFYLIFSVGLAGIVRIIRQLAYGEKIKFGNDFVTGIKQNAPQYLAVTLFFAVVRVAILYCLNSASVRILGDILFGYSLIFLIPLGLYMTVVIAVYSNRLFGNLKTSFSVLIRGIFRSIGIVILLIIPFIFQLIPYFGVVVHIVSRCVTSLAFGVIALIWVLFALSRFDVLINYEQHPELVGKGLFKDTEQNKSDGD